MISNVKKYLDFRLLGLSGSIFMILSQFLPWFSDLTLLNIYIITTSLAIEDSFLYLFPLISGLICFIGTFIIVYKQEYRINSVIVNFVGLGFFLIFLLELIPRELIYLPTIGVGFYFSILGLLLVFFDILHILLTNKNQEEGNIPLKEKRT
ncbi:MAG: hypothetical protein EAX89_06645 [Candidatus Lokiarchaeota archaeon]|nr:hypothetical protein [Candidatus Lokiarchaeota archaeon]